MKITIEEKEALDKWAELRKEQFGEELTEQEKMEYFKMLKNLEKFNRWAELRKEQFGEEVNQDSKLELAKIKKKITRLSKEDIKNLIEDLKKML